MTSRRLKYFPYSSNFLWCQQPLGWAPTWTLVYKGPADADDPDAC